MVCPPYGPLRVNVGYWCGGAKGQDGGAWMPMALVQVDTKHVQRVLFAVFVCPLAECDVVLRNDSMGECVLRPLQHIRTCTHKLFAAVLFGAVLSSFNSLLNSSATLFGFDLYKKFFNQEASERKAVKAGKYFGLGLAAVSMIIAPLIAKAPDGLFDYIQQALGSLSVPILAVVLVGILTKKVPAIGAKVVMIVGVILYICTIFMRPAYQEAALAEAASNGITDAARLAIIEAGAFPHYLHVMGILFIVNVLIMLIFGAIKPKTDIYVPKQTEAIDTTPWKYAWIVGGLIVLLVLSTYLIF